MLQLSKPLPIDKLQTNHIVFLPFKENCSDLVITEAFSLLKNLFDTLCGISSFQYGKCADLSLDKNYIFEMAFTDCVARDHYLTHDTHIKAAEFIIPLLKNGKQSIIAFDYLKHKKFLDIHRSQFFKSATVTHTANDPCPLDEGVIYKK
ncbi:stress responsive A/B barrel domain protein [Candidatus Rickettsiella viridis]|uniref:Stress responsive A/B barrel domain protein n=1 Tax=Candidatus Rickettsiella viridis TaxID=676208 RepID=A0A2Z5UVD7_9COXI|nr:Dabb family protein [Candidatus Rickettsiella viridis]BBB14981.1 stress responsive A/B barrel domain protein [Candidatus Rickettsiella viridis]